LKAVAGESNEQLLIEAAQSDPARFAEVYEANFDRVYAFVARRTASRDEAQDVTAEVFQRALAGLANCKWQGIPFAAWCIGIARNVLASHSYQNAAEDEISQELGADGNSEQPAILTQLLESLPEDQKRVIVGRFLEQKSIGEIAQEIRRSEGAVKQLQLRALRKLRDSLRSKSS